MPESGLCRQLLTGEGQFLLIALPGRRALEAKMLSGNAQMRSLESRLVEIDLPLEFPERAPARIPVVQDLRCKAAECIAALKPSDSATLSQSH
jgi:hypothetical protein